MKIRTLALATVALVTVAGTASASDATGWYAGIAAGYDFMPTLDWKQGSVPHKQELVDSALVTGSLGYKFDQNWRLEGEVGYVNAPLGKSANLDGHERISSMLLNLNYDMPIDDKLAVTVGLGAGWGWGALLAQNTAANFVGGTRSNFMWQAIAGVSYSLTDNLDLTLDARYRDLMVDKVYGSSMTTKPLVKKITDVPVMLGLRWYMDAKAAPPPPPPPPAPPPAPAPAPAAAAPPPPPAVKTFIVFFDFDKSNLTSEAQSVVAEAVKAAQSQGSVKVVVTGHTDTVGSKAYNQALSERRASSVKAEMVRLGLGANEITTVGKNFSEPLVPTGPGVREPQNRRAVIDLGN
jgi:outer membrane protein OmpA-like peptidoglycan-associated protein